MSHSMVPLNIVSALKKAVEFLGGDRALAAVNAEQHEFLGHSWEYNGLLSQKFSEKELRAYVDTVAANLNAILKQEGFSIELSDFAPGNFGVVSILDILVEWLKVGDVREVSDAQGTLYPAVEFEDVVYVDGVQQHIFTSAMSPAHTHPIATLMTKSGDKLCLTVAGEELSGFALIKRIDDIRGGASVPANYEYLRFPMIDYDKKIDISWLQGLQAVSSVGRPYEVAKALQQTKFKMNQYGARLKDAVAIEMGCTSVRPPPPRLIIDRPFFLWIERPGVPVPVMYAYFDEGDWKDPGDLENM